MAKHLSSSQKLTEEAIDRSLKTGQGVTDKMRAVIDEIAGMSDDFPKTPESLPSDLRNKFESINRESRQLRKDIWAKQLTTINTDEGDLRDVRNRIKRLKDQVYDIATEEHMATHAIESLAPDDHGRDKFGPFDLGVRNGPVKVYAYLPEVKERKSNPSSPAKSASEKQPSTKRGMTRSKRSKSKAKGLLGLGILPVRRIGSRVRERLE